MLTSSGKQDCRSVPFDLDMIPWIEAKAKEQSAHFATIVRQAVREKMLRERPEAKDEGTAA